MTEKEAREIYEKMRGTILLPDPSKLNEPIRQFPLESVSEFCKAEGYLEAIEKAERILVKALKKFIDEDLKGKTTISKVPRMEAEEAIAEWEKEK